MHIGVPKEIKNHENRVVRPATTGDRIHAGRIKEDVEGGTVRSIHNRNEGRYPHYSKASRKRAAHETLVLRRD